MSQGLALDKEKVLESLRPYFLLGYNRNKACVLAKFDPSLLNKWEQADPELSIKINAWIGYVSSKARENLAEEITANKNSETSKWWLERREKKDFSTRTEITGEEGKPLEANINLSKLTQEELDKLEELNNKATDTEGTV